MTEYPVNFLPAGEVLHHQEVRNMRFQLQPDPGGVLRGWRVVRSQGRRGWRESLPVI